MSRPLADLLGPKPENPRLLSALAHARAGIPVLPLHHAVGAGCSCGDEDCRSPGKHPRSKNGLDDATSDADTIRAWWEKWPKANLGGRLDGLVAVDVDIGERRRGGKLVQAHGDKTLARLERAHGELDRALVQKTGSGGEHILFRLPVGVRLPKTLGPDVDLKWGKKGYILLEPSNHVSGGRYEWDVALKRLARTIVDLPEAPAWFCDTEDAESKNTGGELATIVHNSRQFETFADLADAVRAVKNDERFESRDAWRDVIAAIHFESEGSEEGRELAHEWSAKWKHGDDADYTDKTWVSLRDDPGKRLNTGRIIIKYARENGWRPKAVPGVITIRPEDLNENLAAVDEAVATQSEELNVYRRGGAVVHIQSEKSPAIFEGKETETWSRALTLTTPAQMQQIAMRASSFQVYDGRSKKTKATQCPPQLAAHYLQMVARSKVPVLRALTNHPTTRPDGSTLQTAGFDSATGLLYEPDAAFPHVPDAPTKEEARAALKLLKRVVRGFEFASDLDRTVWLCAVLTAIVRDSLPIAPFFAFDAPLPGSGKTILASGVSVIALGYTAAPTSQTDPDEERKTVASLLFRNAPFLFFDNCERPIQPSTLCEIATSPEWEARLLGTNRAPTLPTNITVMFTGNNLEIVGDIIERTLMCRLQPTTGRPSERAYGWSFEGECKERRPELVAAALTVIRGYIASGAGDMGLKPSRLPAWERLTRFPLAWLGEGDVVDTIEQLRQIAAAEDSDSQFLAKLVEAWWTDHRDSGVRLAEIEDDSNAGQVFSLLSDRFEGEHFDGINVRAASKFLAKHKGQIVGGKYFAQKIDRKGVSMWRLKLAND